MRSQDVADGLVKVSTSERAEANAWFFKTGKGQYGYGDKFLGVTVPQQRKIAKKFKDLPLKEVEKLIKSPWHEERLTGLFILVSQFERGNEATKKEIYNFYLSNSGPVGAEIVRGPHKTLAKRVFWGINNWDLVDSSAHKIVGPWLEDKPEKMDVLTKLAHSDVIWERRIAILSTFQYIGKGRAEEAIIIAHILLNDEHDLIQKAVGWMLREIGKRVDRHLLLDFLNDYAATMPRTTLRYAIEHLDKETRKFYLGLKNKQ